MKALCSSFFTSINSSLWARFLRLRSFWWERASRLNYWYLMVLCAYMTWFLPELIFVSKIIESLSWYVFLCWLLSCLQLSLACFQRRVFWGWIICTLGWYCLFMLVVLMHLESLSCIFCQYFPMWFGLFPESEESVVLASNLFPFSSHQQAFAW